MEIKLKMEYRGLTTEELENWLFRLQGLSGGRIYSISKDGLNIPINYCEEDLDMYKEEIA